MISIDGMRPDYVTAADQHGLKIPNLRHLLATGAHAEECASLPTVTYPSHTTLITGVWPAKHGIYNNVAFDPLFKNFDGWYWYSEDIKVPTLWQAASKAGYLVGSVSWPVSVGARVAFLIPEFWRATTPDDLKLERALSTPGLLSEFQEKLGPYVTDLNDAIPSDWGRTRYAEAIIRSKHARFVTVHLAALDHLEHAAGPFSAEANSTLEEIDKMVGVLEEGDAGRNSQRSLGGCLRPWFRIHRSSVEPEGGLREGGLDHVGFEGRGRARSGGHRLESGALGERRFGHDCPQGSE